ncbi:unnamed protein product [Chilo suppressalis]|uniref:DUF7041 domain-containing protein n=1 Tax=Chilo suppressalis TaxID=168631 RepID=A0ABN8B211_CHISP|nr:unnamed protein product [Chilo suppressalis]
MAVAKLNKEALRQVSDLIQSPPATEKYNALKRRLIAVYEESAESQFQKLVSEMDLGTQKPSQLLRIRYRLFERFRKTQLTEISNKHKATRVLTTQIMRQVPQPVNVARDVGRHLAGHVNCVSGDKVAEQMSPSENVALDLLKNKLQHTNTNMRARISAKERLVVTLRVHRMHPTNSFSDVLHRSLDLCPHRDSTCLYTLTASCRLDSKTLTEDGGARAMVIADCYAALTRDAYGR